MNDRTKRRSSISLQAGDITDSAIAAGNHASAKIGSRKIELSPAQTSEIEQILDLIIFRLGRLEETEVRQDAEAVREEVRRKKVNVGLLRPALKGIAASLASVQSLSDIAANLLALTRHLG